MKKFIASVLLGVAALAAPAMPIGYIGDIGEEGKASLLLHNTPCTNAKALEIIPEDLRNQFFHGEYTFKDGHIITACWGTDGKAIYIADEEGSKGMLPIDAVIPLTKL